MAEVVKSLKTEKKPKEIGLGLKDIPKLEESENIVKPLKEKKNQRPRAGRIQMAPNPYGDPKIIENGNRIK